MPGRPNRREQIAFAQWAAQDSDMVSALLALVGHDLRTPLNAVIGFSDAMERQLFGPLGDQRYEEYARHIRESGAALLRAAEQTLALAALTAGRMPAERSAIRIGDMILEAMEGLGPLAHQRPRSVSLDLPAGVEVEHQAAIIDLAIGYLVKAVARPDFDVRISASVTSGEVVMRWEAQADNGHALPLPGYAELARLLLEGQGCAVDMNVGTVDVWAATIAFREAAQAELGLQD